MRKMQLIVPLRLRKMILTLMLTTVSSVWMTNKAEDMRLPSLCDEWNVLEHLTALGPDYESFGTLHFRLTSDTMINAMHYVRLEQDGTYKGALREGTNADIYYVPNNSTHEYLLYAFNAQVGDSLGNLWFGANEIDRFIINSATVVNIESTTPRKFTIGFEWQSVYSYAAINDTSEIMYAELVWLEGVGFQFGGPLSYECPFDCAGGPGLLTLCAYKNGEQVYADPYWSEKIGCEYNRHTLPSLCDEWNVVLTIHHEEATRYWTYTQKLTTDTIINEHLYAQSYCDNKYIGAFREGENRDIYCVPATTNEEYLVYAWNAQVGDTLYNLLVGGGIMYALGFSDKAVMREIKETVPRTFVVDYEYIYNRKIDSADTTWWEYQWIEGVGMTCGPSGDICPFDFVGDPVKSDILCAYKNGEQIYVSDMGEQYGCVYNYDPYSTPSDTIPLFFYTSDDPGSSTVDPVDPNQVVATLQGDLLTIHEHSGVDVTYSLQHNAPSQMPSPHRAPQSDTFRDMVTLQITESGEYQLLLTNPSWGYSIFGNFIYAPQGIEQTSSSSQGGETSRLVLMNGQIYILRGEKIYTLTGQEVR